MRQFNNRQMSAAFKAMGFHKSNLQLTRIGISYSHPLSNALFTFAKRMDGGVTSSAPGEDRMWSFPIGLTSEKYWALRDDGMRVPLNDKPGSTGEEMTAREALLCVARHFGEMLEKKGEKTGAHLTLVQK